MDGNWYLMVHEGGLSPFREAYGPFTTADRAADHVDPVIKAYLEINNVEWSDVELLTFEIIFAPESEIIKQTEEKAIIVPPKERQSNG